MLLAVISLFSLTGCGSYNHLVTLDQNVNQSWAQVQSVYQRRADLIPNLVNTVQGAANFEKSTLIAVTNARASVGRVQLDPNKAPTDAAQLEQFQAAQGQLSNALSRLLVVSENYPQLKRRKLFSLAGATRRHGKPHLGRAENFNTTVQDYNTALRVSDQPAEQDVWLPAAAVLQRAARSREGAGGELRLRKSTPAPRSGGDSVRLEVILSSRMISATATRWPCARALFSLA